MEPKEYLQKLTEASIDCATDATTQVVTSVIGTLIGGPVAGFAVPVGLKFFGELAKSKIQEATKDVCQRQLSDYQAQKVQYVCQQIASTLYELAQKDIELSQEISVDAESYLRNSFEMAEHVLLNSVQETQTKKLNVLGRFYALAIYTDDYHWHDLHKLTNDISKLTFRQIVMVHLLAMGFFEKSQNRYITDPSACVEMWNLLDFGFTRTRGAFFGMNKSSKLAFENIVPTKYASVIDSKFMLDYLSKEDIEDVIKSMNIQVIQSETQEGSTLEVSDLPSTRVEKNTMIINSIGKKRTYGEE